MNILIKNGILISMDENRQKIEENMDILILNNKIAKIGKEITASVDKIIDANKKVIMPGLINTHAHVPMSIFRETLDGYGLQEWLENKIWPAEAKLTNEDIYYASYLTFLEMIKTGTTTVNDMYFVTDEIIKAMEECQVRLQTSTTLMNIAGNIDKTKTLEELERLINTYKNKERLTFNTAIHSLYTCDSNYVDKCIEFSKNNSLNIHMHFCENENELTTIESIHNKKPIDILKEKFKDSKVILAHCVKLSEDDIESIRDMDVNISHCPVSNLKLGCGIAKINYMLEKGINIALGTDGQGSGSSMDLFEVMKYTALLQKGMLEDATKMNSYDILKMATINGAKALGLDDEIGSIEVGKKADIILIDTTSLLATPKNNLISQIVYNIKGSDVDTTIIDGNILMENKTLKNTKLEEIIKKCEEISQNILN